MHLDIFKRSLPLHRLKMFINIDAEPRIWNTSFTLRRVLELYRDELKDLPPDINRMELNRIINDRLATDLPSHRLSYPPLCRSEERRVGKECVSTCRSRWSPYH